MGTLAIPDHAILFYPNNFLIQLFWPASQDQQEAMLMQQMKFADAHSGDVLQTGRRQADDDKSTTYKDPYLADEDDVPRNGLDLTDEQRERREKAKLVQGRRELLRIFWHENRDVLWSIDPSLKWILLAPEVPQTKKETASHKYIYIIYI